MPGPPDIVTVVEACAEHPRHAAPSMVRLSDGSIFLAWMQTNRSTLEANDEAPSDIVAMNSRDGGRTWSDRQMLIPRGEHDTAAYKPSLLRLQNGEILFRYEMYHHLMTNEELCASSFVCTSSDECRTFSEPVTIFHRRNDRMGSFHDVRQMASGRIVIPNEYYQGEFCNDDHGMGGCYYSDDNGQTWEECENYVDLPLRGAEEPKIEELKDGRLIMVMRTQLGSVFKAMSEDGGRTWSKGQTTGLTAPESCPAITRVRRTGDLLLVFNHSPYDPAFDHYGMRTPLSIALSSDEGETWHTIRDIETDPEWEFTNPAPYAVGNDTILVAYEASKYADLTPPGKLGRTRMHLKMAIVDVDWLYEA